MPAKSKKKSTKRKSEKSRQRPMTSKPTPEAVAPIAAPAKDAPGSSFAGIGKLSLILLSLVGMAASIYLTYQHIVLKRGGQVGGLCDVSDTLNCLGVLQSDYAAVFGVPISIITFAFYGALLMLAGTADLAALARSPRWRLVRLLTLLSLPVSGVLLFLMLTEIGALCPVCLAIDAVNLLSVVVAFAAVGDPIGKQLKDTFTNLGEAVNGTAGGIVLGSFVAVLLIFVIGIRPLIPPADAEVDLDEAYAVVFGERRVPVNELEFAPRLGPDDAPVTLIEFSDFECPFCARLSGTMERLHTRFPDSLQIIFMNYPLSNECNDNVDTEFHQTACLGAFAAFCANQQDGFWSYHDRIFANQRDITEDNVREWAIDERLDPDLFMRCVHDDSTHDRVRAQAEQGRQARSAAGDDGGGTPFSFVNGLLIPGGRTFNEYEALIRREMIRAGVADPVNLEAPQP